jgi:serine phosphatase RsbU (regulator of sigma subunit)
VNRSRDQRAGMIDDRGTFISAAKDELRGKNADQFSDKRVSEIAINAMKTNVGITQTFDKLETIGGVPLAPSMVSVEPIDIPGGHRWLVVIGSDLADVDRLVEPIFRDALTWAIVLMVAVTAILASTATQMIRSRLRLERAQMELINKEMEQARQIQLNWLPEQPCEIKGIDIAAVNTPASHVSGDFYNWFELPDGRVAIIIGDVTGHGMSAAFLMATTQLLVRTNLPRLCDPGFCMEEVNRQLCTQVFNGQFVTMLIAIIDLENRHIDIASGGHPPPFVSEDGEIRALPIDPALVLGVEETTEYPTQRLPLSASASLLLYTDGVPDAISPSGDRFSAEKLKSSLDGRFTSARQMLDMVMRSINNFRTGVDLSDDLTLVAVQLKPTSVPKAPMVAASELAD